MITRDLIVIVSIVITILLGVGLRLKRVADIRWNMIYVLPTVISLIHFWVSNRNIFMYLVYFVALLELLLLFLRLSRWHLPSLQIQTAIHHWDMYEFYGLGSTRNIQNAYAEIYKNYYGMTLIQLDSGEYVAANVEKDSSADRAGNKNGTVVTKWNGCESQY